MTTPIPFLQKHEAWPMLRGLLEQAVALFGPSHEAHAMTQRACAVMQRWLCALEAIARRLLLVAATDVALPTTTPRAPAKYRSTKAKRTAPRATFKLCAPPRKATRRSRRYGFRAPVQLSPQRLAARLEALLRIAADPTPFARRVARRLQRDRTLAARINRGRIAPTALFAREHLQATALVWDSLPESYANSS